MVADVGLLFGTDRSAIVSPATNAAVLVPSEHVVALLPDTVHVMFVVLPFFITVNAYDLLVPGFVLSEMLRLDSVPAVGIGMATVL